MSVGRTLAAFAATLVLSGCSSDASSDNSPAPVTDSTPTAPTSSSTSTVKGVQSCSKLLSDGWEPPTEETPDFSYDQQTGVVVVTFTGDKLVLDIAHDDACQDLPVIGKMLTQILKEDVGAS
jgi:hypothetical protein